MCWENVYFVDRFHDSALHGDRCTAGYEERTNFADESARLTDNNVLNEGNFLTEKAVPLHVDIPRTTEEILIVADAAP
jgi:hypothetical protein